MIQPYASRSHEKMKEVLMDPNASGPDIHYYMIRGGSKKGNITVWESGTIGGTAKTDGSSEGGEYIKTYGHYHVGKLDETYTVISGEGIIVMQVRKTDSDGKPIDDQIESFKAIRVKTGDSVFIPSGAGHFAVNIGKTWFVTHDDSPVNFDEKNPVSMPGHADYEPFRKLHGAAYYIVEKNGRPELVKNPNYSIVPEVRL